MSAGVGNQPGDRPAQTGQQHIRDIGVASRYGLLHPFDAHGHCHQEQSSRSPYCAPPAPGSQQAANPRQRQKWPQGFQNVAHAGERTHLPLKRNPVDRIGAVATARFKLGQRISRQQTHACTSQRPNTHAGPEHQQDRCGHTPSHQGFERELAADDGDFQDQNREGKEHEQPGCGSSSDEQCHVTQGGQGQSCFQRCKRAKRLRLAERVAQRFEPSLDIVPVQ